MAFVIFPGQGSQKALMGLSFLQDSFVSDCVVKASDIVSRDVRNLLISADDSILSDTSNAQIALFVLNYSIAMVLKNRGLKIDLMAGHSLGEYVALTIAEVLSFEEMCRLIDFRGKVMSEIKDGGMLALVGCSLSQACAIASLASCVIETSFDLCFVANDNSNSQVVLSGSDSALTRAVFIASSFGVKAIRLKTSGPFHSPLMSSAASKLRDFVKTFSFSAPKIPVISNLYASFVEDWKDVVVDHLVGPVRWRESLIFGMNHEIEIIEIGSSSVLSNMAKRDGIEIKYLGSLC